MTGLPIASQLIIVSVGLTLIQRAVNAFGQSMIASFTVGNRIESLFGSYDYLVERHFRFRGWFCDYVVVLSERTLAEKSA